MPDRKLIWSGSSPSRIGMISATPRRAEPSLFNADCSLCPILVVVVCTVHSVLDSNHLYLFFLFDNIRITVVITYVSFFSCCYPFSTYDLHVCILFTEIIDMIIAHTPRPGLDCQCSMVLLLLRPSTTTFQSSQCQRTSVGCISSAK